MPMQRSWPNRLEVSPRDSTRSGNLLRARNPPNHPIRPVSRKRFGRSETPRKKARHVVAARKRAKS